MTSPGDQPDSLEHSPTRAGHLKSIAPSPEHPNEREAESEIGGSTASDMQDLAADWERSDGGDASIESRYEFEEKIGAGGMGGVWRAIDRRLQRPVAIKRINDDLVRSRRAADRFLTEARAVAALNHHHIVQVYDFGCDTDGHFIAMELVQGRSLAEHLAANGPFEPEVAVDLATQFCDALSAAHAQGIIHRDLKPANILLSEIGTRDGSLVSKITDFGLARFDGGDGGHTQTGAVLGTYDYMPTEQRRDATKVDARSDLWSLAVTLYEMLTGESPKLIHARKIPETLRETLLKAMEADPEKRFASVAEFRDALTDAQSAPSSIGGPTRACPACGHDNGDVNTFCQKCGRNLYDDCLTCGDTLEPDATFCGKCGANVREDVARRAELLQSKRREVAALQDRFEYELALKRLDAFSGINHSALANFVKWSGRTREKLEQEIDEFKQSRASLLQTAQVRARENDDDGVIQILEMVPEPFRNNSVEELLSRARSRQSEIAQLRVTIRKGFAAREYRRLIPYVERLAKLLPDDKKVLELRRKLRRQFPEGYRQPQPASGRSAGSSRAVAPIIEDSTAPQTQPRASRETHRSAGAAQATLSVRLTRKWFETPLAVRIGAGSAIGLLLVTVVVFAMKSGGTSSPVNGGDLTRTSPSGLRAKNGVPPKVGDNVALSNQNSIPTGNPGGGKSSEPAGAAFGANAGEVAITKSLVSLQPSQQATMSLARATFTPDGRRVLLQWNGLAPQVWQLDGEIRYLATCQPTKNVPQIRGGFGAISADGKYVAVSCSGARPRVVTSIICDAETGEGLVECAGDFTHVSGPTFLPDNTTVAVDAKNKVARFSLESPQLKLLGNARGGYHAVTPNGRFYVNCFGGKIDVQSFDGFNVRWTHNFGRHRRVVFNISDDGRYVAVAAGVTSKRTEFKIWNIKTGAILKEWDDLGEPVTAVRFVGSDRLASASTYVRLWDIRTGTNPLTFNLGEEDPLSGIGYSGKLSAIYAATRTGKLYRMLLERTVAYQQPAPSPEEIVKRSTSRPPRPAEPPASEPPTRLQTAPVAEKKYRIPYPQQNPRSGLAIRYSGAAFSRDASRALIGFSNDQFEVWQLEPAQKLLCRIRPDTGGSSTSLQSFTLAKDGTRAVVTAFNRRKRLPGTSAWDATTGKQIAALSGAPLPTSSVAIHPDGRTILTAANSGTVGHWTFESPQFEQFQVSKAIGHAKLAISANGRLIAVRRGGTIEVLSFPDGRLQQTVKATFDAKLITLNHCLSSDGRYLAACGKDILSKVAGVRIWETQTGKLIQSWNNPPSVINKVMFAYDDTVLIGLGHDLMIWDVNSGKTRSQTRLAGEGWSEMSLSEANGRLVFLMRMDGDWIRKIPGTIQVMDISKRVKGE